LITFTNLKLTSNIKHTYNIKYAIINNIRYIKIKFSNIEIYRIIKGKLYTENKVKKKTRHQMNQYIYIIPVR